MLPNPFDSRKATAYDHRLTGAELIRAERRRQIEQLGYTLEHDDRLHTSWQLWYAAVCYRDALDASAPINRHVWPFEDGDWKPKDRLANLVRAGALFQAAADHAERVGERGMVGTCKDQVKDVAAMADSLLWRRRAGLPDWASDAVYVNVQVGVGWRERLAILFGANIYVRAMVFCENPPGRTAAETVMTADRIRPGQSAIQTTESHRKPDITPAN